MNIKKLYNIYFDYQDCNPPQYLGTTNNLERWLKENNENRQEGFKDTLDDFLIKECILLPCEPYPIIEIFI